MRVTLDYSQHSERQPGSGLSTDEWEFAQAMAAFQHAAHRRYPTWSEVLRVAKSLGYRKPDRSMP